MSVVVSRLEAPAVIAAIEEIERRNLFTLNHFRTRALSHLAAFIQVFGRFHQPGFLRSECTLLMRKWAAFTDLNRAIPSQFSSLKESEINNLFLSKGLCTGAIVLHLSQFHQTRSPIQSVPLPVVTNMQKGFSNLLFYPFKQLDSTLGENTSHLRFLQAAFKIASSANFMKGDSIQYLPESILTQHHLRLNRRLPPRENLGTCAFPIGDLLKVLKEIRSQDDENASESQSSQKRTYWLALGGPQDHSIALCLQAPFHFFDPAYGLAVSQDADELCLYLANYLTDKYPDHSAFVLLEFMQAVSEDLGSIFHLFPSSDGSN